jgi:lipase chaperone LimK
MGMKVRSLGFRLTAVAVVGLIVIGIIGWRQTPSNDVAAPTPPGVPFVHSMEGTVPDGSLGAWKAGRSADAAGPLALGELRRMFDYYLSAVGEKSIAAITQEINVEIDHTLSPTNVPKAKRILGLYLEFKRELLDLERRPGISGQDVHAIRNRMLAMQELRSHYFNAEETQAMFGFDDAYDADAVARLEVSQDPSLSAKQKQDKLAALDATMSPELLREREAPRVVVRMEEEVAAMRAKGATDDDVYRLRAKEFDAPAADRLAALDRDEAQWKQRIAQYLAARTQLLATPATAADPDHATALSNLQRAQFTEEERRRLPAYEQ